MYFRIFEKCVFLVIATFVTTANSFRLQHFATPILRSTTLAANPFFLLDRGEGIGRRHSTTRQGKAETLQQLAKWLEQSKAIITLNLVKFTPNDRLKLRESLLPFLKGDDTVPPSMAMKVVKNTLMKIATKDTQFKGLYDKWKGMNLQLFIFNDEIIPKVMQALAKAYKDHRPLKRRSVLVGAAYGDSAMPANELITLKDVDSKETLVGILVYLLQFPATSLTATLNHVPTSLAATLNEIANRSNET